MEFHFLNGDFEESIQDNEIFYLAELYHFRTKGEEQTSQILKDGETLELIENPPDKENAFFYGWYPVTVQNITDSGKISYQWENDPERIAFQKKINISMENASVIWQINGRNYSTPADAEGCAHVFLAPLYSNYYFINFHLGAWDTANRETILTRKLAVLGADNQADVRIGNIIAPSPDARHLVFTGWQIPAENLEYLTLDNQGNEKNNRSQKTGYYLSCYQQNLELYPVFTEARWFHFDTGSSGNGASYVGSKYLLTNDTEQGTCFETLPVSRRNGFRFLGWYFGDVPVTDENGNILNQNFFYPETGEKQFEIIPSDSTNGRLYAYSTIPADTLQSGITFSAKWEEIQDTCCHVILWKQKISDAPDTSQKQYDYETSSEFCTVSGKTLDDILHSGEIDSYLHQPVTGFFYSHSEMNRDVVSGDGSTIINIYYDRNIHTLTFQVPQYRENITVREITALYGQDISSYFPIIGNNGITYNNGERWNPQNSKTFQHVLVLINSMPDEDIVFQLSTSQASRKYLNYYTEALPDDDGDVTHNGMKYNLYRSVSAKYQYITEAEDFMELSGFTRQEAEPAFSNGRINSNTANFYYTRNRYFLTFDVNYPNFADLIYPDTPAENKTVEISYGASLASYAESYDISRNAPEGYFFDGWYEDDKCTVRFDFHSFMQSANKVVYAKWTPVKYLIRIDPNGGIIDHINHNTAEYSGTVNGYTWQFPTFRFDNSGYRRNQSTYINAEFGETLSEYTISREYIEITEEKATELGTDKVYYYLNTQYQESDGAGLPSDLRNSLYLTEGELETYFQFYQNAVTASVNAYPESFADTCMTEDFDLWKACYLSEQKYAKLSDVSKGQSYQFLGWYQVFDDGTVSKVPYDFTAPVSGALTLKAMWRLDGGYRIQYLPEYTTDDGIVVNGTLSAWYDPSDDGTFADQSEIIILRQPASIAVNGILTDEYIFKGWQIVSICEGTSGLIYTPLENEIYYQSGDVFTVQAKYADQNSVISMQAVYENYDVSQQRPEIANLILDAGQGFLNQNGVLPWHSSAVCTVRSNTETNQISFSNLQSNTAVHLNQYTDYFSHKNYYTLLGFSKSPDGYSIDYSPNAVISVQRMDTVTLYAVWKQTEIAPTGFRSDSQEAFTIMLIISGLLYLSVVMLKRHRKAKFYHDEIL
ncbi:MAG: InlB B-repeat-containing protein [Oscillospiraceae bacterium]|nr:InlB B-repeat-containing protein [Oscillospiraceae bacterium]